MIATFKCFFPPLLWALIPKGLVPPRDHEVFLDENHLPGKKVKFFCGKYFSFWMPLQNPISFLGV